MTVKNLKAEVLAKIAREHRYGMGKGSRGAVCVLVSSLVHSGDVEALVEIGVARRVAQEAIEICKRSVA